MKRSFLFPLIAVAVLAGCSKQGATPAAGSADAAAGKPVAFK